MKRLIAPILIVLLVTACADKDLETVAKSLLTTSQALGTLQGAVIAANTTTPKLISDDGTRGILQICVQINQASLEASQVTRNINKLAPADRTRLSQILDPVITSVGNGVTTLNALGITDQKTRDTVQTSLLLIQTSLNAAKLALAAR